MQGKRVALGALVAALAALVASAAWAATRGDHGWMMSRDGAGMMGYASSGDGERVKTLAAARAQAAEFADRLDLQVGEAMQFTNGFYVELEEAGSPATEVLVDPENGAVFLEHGPAMMWNERYGMMSDDRFRDDDAYRDMMGDGGMMGGAGGMMGGGGMMDAGMMGGGMMGGEPTFAPEAEDGAVTAGEAVRIANRWLADQADGLAAREADAFPGYYTLHVERGGKVAGMVSVHGSSGTVWYHGWHGRFVAMAG